MNQPSPGVPNTGAPFFLVCLENKEIKSLLINTNKGDKNEKKTIQQAVN